MNFYRNFQIKVIDSSDEYKTIVWEILYIFKTNSLNAWKEHLTIFILVNLHNPVGHTLTLFRWALGPMDRLFIWKPIIMLFYAKRMSSHCLKKQFQWNYLYCCHCIIIINCMILSILTQYLDLNFWRLSGRKYDHLVYHKFIWLSTIA